MAKKFKKILIKFNRKKKYIKDKAIINFILQHEKKVSIDFSKIKIPPFFKFLKYDSLSDTTKISEANIFSNFGELETNENSISLDDRRDL